MLYEVITVKFGWPMGQQSSVGRSYKDGREERWFYVIDGRFHEFLFVDERVITSYSIHYTKLYEA